LGFTTKAGEWTRAEEEEKKKSRTTGKLRETPDLDGGGGEGTEQPSESPRGAENGILLPSKLAFFKGFKNPCSHGGEKKSARRGGGGLRKKTQ